MIAERSRLVTIRTFLVVLLALSCSKDDFQCPNIAPVPSFTVIPLSGTTQTVFQFDASGSWDTEDAVSALEVRWDWANDGTWDTEWSAAKEASHQYNAVGTKIIKMSVKDTDGATDDTTGTVVILNPNTPPIASFSVTPESGAPDTVFRFDASRSSDAEDTVSVLQARWDWENDGTWDTEWAIAKTATHQYGTVGTKTIGLSVMDSEGATDDTAQTLTVVSPDMPPTASFSVYPEVGTAETFFNFNAHSCSDPQDPASSLKVRWDFEDDGSWDLPWSTSKTTVYQYEKPGIKTVRLEVQNTRGLTDDATDTLKIWAYPRANIRVYPPSGTTKTVFEFDASLSSDYIDPVADLKVQWDWESDGVWDTELSTTKTASHQYGQAGTKEITLLVMNTMWLTGEASLTLGVASSNKLPWASFTVAPTYGTIDTVFRFDASRCSDVEDSLPALWVRWDWDNDNTWDTEWSTMKTASQSWEIGAGSGEWERLLGG